MNLEHGDYEVRDLSEDRANEAAASASGNVSLLLRPAE